MYVTVNVYTSGKRFNEVHGAYVRLLTGSDELCKYNLRDEPSFSSTSAMFFARLSKSSPSSGWELEALGEAGNNPDARTANDLKEVCSFALPLGWVDGWWMVDWVRVTMLKRVSNQVRL